MRLLLRWPIVVSALGRSLVLLPIPPRPRRCPASWGTVRYARRWSDSATRLAARQRSCHLGGRCVG